MLMTVPAAHPSSETPEGIGSSLSPHSEVSLSLFALTSDRTSPHADPSFVNVSDFVFALGVTTSAESALVPDAAGVVVAPLQATVIAMSVVAEERRRALAAVVVRESDIVVGSKNGGRRVRGSDGTEKRSLVRSFTDSRDVPAALVREMPILRHFEQRRTMRASNASDDRPSFGTRSAIKSSSVRWWALVLWGQALIGLLAYWLIGLLAYWLIGCCCCSAVRRRVG
jgi:hypothetical protein